MSKLTPIQVLEERITKLESTGKYLDWHTGQWYKTFEQPLRADVDMLKEKQEKREVKDYWDNLKSECSAVKPKKSIDQSLIDAYWLSCFAWCLFGAALMFAVLVFSGRLQ